MNVRKYAKELVKEYSLYKLSYRTLEDILDDLGFVIVRFDKRDKDIVDLFNSLKLDEATKSKKCFTYVCEQYRQVYLSEYLSSEEYIFMLLHEIGHIKMKHILKGHTYCDELDEKEAHEFAFAVLQYIDRKNKRKKVNRILSNVLLSIFAVGTISLFVYAMKLLYDYNHSEDSRLVDTSVSAEELDLNPVETDMISSSVSETSLAEESSIVTTTSAPETEPPETEPPKTEPIQTTTSSEPPADTSEEEIYYITSSGKKYHKEFCSVIQNRTNLYYGYKENLEAMGYEPCHLCIGEE